MWSAQPYVHCKMSSLGSTNLYIPKKRKLLDFSKNSAMFYYGKTKKGKRVLVLEGGSKSQETLKRGVGLERNQNPSNNPRKPLKKEVLVFREGFKPQKIMI